MTLTPTWSMGQPELIKRFWDWAKRTCKSFSFTSWVLWGLGRLGEEKHTITQLVKGKQQKGWKHTFRCFRKGAHFPTIPTEIHSFVMIFSSNYFWNMFMRKDIAVEICRKMQHHKGAFTRQVLNCARLNHGEEWVHVFSIWAVNRTSYHFLLYTCFAHQRQRWAKWSPWFSLG